MIDAKRFGRLLQKWGKALAGAQRAGAAGRPSGRLPGTAAFAGPTPQAAAVPQAAVPTVPSPSPSPPAPPSAPPLLTAKPLAEPPLSRMGKLAVRLDDAERAYRESGGRGHMFSAAAALGSAAALLHGDDYLGHRAWRQQVEQAQPGVLLPHGPTAGVGAAPAAVVTQAGGPTPGAITPPPVPAAALGLTAPPAGLGPINVGGFIGSAGAAMPTPPSPSAPAFRPGEMMGTAKDWQQANRAGLADAVPGSYRDAYQENAKQMAGRGYAETFAGPGGDTFDIHKMSYYEKLFGGMGLRMGDPSFRKDSGQWFARFGLKKATSLSSLPQAGTFGPQLNPAGIPPSASPPLLPPGGAAAQATTPFPKVLSNVLGGGTDSLAPALSGPATAEASSRAGGDMAEVVRLLRDILTELRKKPGGDDSQDESESAENRRPLWRRAETGGGETHGGSGMSGTIEYPAIFRPPLPVNTTSPAT